MESLQLYVYTCFGLRPVSYKFFWLDRAGATHFWWGVFSGTAHGRKASAPEVMSGKAELSDIGRKEEND